MITMTWILDQQGRRVCRWTKMEQAVLADNVHVLPLPPASRRPVAGECVVLPFVRPGHAA